MTILQFLQLEPPSTTGYLITAIGTLVSAIIFLFLYSKSLNAIIKTMSDSHASQQIKQSEEFTNKIKEISEFHGKQNLEFYKESTKDYKETINKNTEAFTEHSEAMKQNTATVRESSKDMSEILNELRAYLKTNK